jgi:hypothetical protein
VSHLKPLEHDFGPKAQNDESLSEEEHDEKRSKLFESYSSASLTGSS